MQRYMYVKHDIVINFQDMHRLAVKAGTRVERQQGGFGGYAVHPSEVKLLTDTKALFVHDACYRFIWVSADDLADNHPGWSMFERAKRKRNLKEGYPETKGLKNGHCNRSGCLAPLEGRPHWWMTDHETFTDARLYYCPTCADMFTRWDQHIKAPIRRTLETDNG